MSKVNQIIVTFRSLLMPSFSLLADLEAAIELYRSHGKGYDIRMNVSLYSINTIVLTHVWLFDREVVHCTPCA